MGKYWSERWDYPVKVLLGRGTPLLRIRQVVYSTKGKATIYVIGFYRSDLHTLLIRRFLFRINATVLMLHTANAVQKAMPKNRHLHQRLIKRIAILRQ